MNAIELKRQLEQLGVVLVAHGDRLRYAPRSVVSPKLAAEIVLCKSELLANASAETWHPSSSVVANEANWRRIASDDFAYLQGPRNYPRPCPWCGGRLKHRPVCDEMRREWIPIMPFGKHRGRRLDELPPGYTEWLLNKQVGSEAFRVELLHWCSAG